jgi:phosphatidylglycerophosphate synthase
MTWANFLTSLRLVTAPLCAWSVIGGHWPAACAVFFFAVATDVLDGMLARRFDQVSAFGGLFDHGTDAIFVTVTLAGLALIGWVPWLLVVLIPSAFIQYTLDSKALAGKALRTTRIGKSNGVLYFGLAGTIIVRQTLEVEWLPVLAISAFAWLLVASTLVSMLDRLVTWRRTAS